VQSLPLPQGTHRRTPDYGRDNSRFLESGDRYRRLSTLKTRTHRRKLEMVMCGGVREIWHGRSLCVNKFFHLIVLHCRLLGKSLR
jgi:hypothetical protein